ncbi:MAG: hypothetical protein WCI67_15265 [Chloroflexales bacterium]
MSAGPAAPPLLLRDELEEQRRELFSNQEALALAAVGVEGRLYLTVHGTVAGAAHALREAAVGGSGTRAARIPGDFFAWLSPHA